MPDACAPVRGWLDARAPLKFEEVVEELGAKGLVHVLQRARRGVGSHKPVNECFSGITGASDNHFYAEKLYHASVCHFCVRTGQYLDQVFLSNV